jgi:hypothetical protein
MAARVIAEIYSGKLSPGCAAGLASLLNLQLRAIEVADLKQRLVRVENLLAQAKKGSDGKADAPELESNGLSPQSLESGEPSGCVHGQTFND